MRHDFEKFLIHVEIQFSRQVKNISEHVLKFWT